MAFAPDGLTSVGGYPGDDDRGGQLFRTVDRPKMMEDFLAAAKWLKARPECTGKIGATGFCFGGGVVQHPGGPGWAPTSPPWRRSTVGGRGCRRAQDQGGGARPPWGDRHPVGRAWPAYEAALKAAGVRHEGHIYPGAGHGFNNDATPARYNKAAADQAWKRTIEWFNQYVRG